MIYYKFFEFNALKGDGACIYYLLIYIYIYVCILPFDNEKCNYKIEIIIFLKITYINIAFFYYYYTKDPSYKI